LYRARCSGVDRSRAIVPAPPWITSTKSRLAASPARALCDGSSGAFSSRVAIVRGDEDEGQGKSAAVARPVENTLRTTSTMW
jgi:hypothetical protein